MRVCIEMDEIYPFVRILSNGRYGRSVEMTEDELKWYDSTMKDFWELQDLLIKKYDGWSNE